MKETILAFIDCINAHDVERLGALMSDDHTFIDAHGNQVSGKDKMIPGLNPRYTRLNCSLTPYARK
jgi:ketosteroid isomerase-like protein